MPRTVLREGVARWRLPWLAIPVGRSISRPCRPLDFLISGGYPVDIGEAFLVSYAPFTFIGEIAQLVERRTHKPKVKGSIPFLATILHKPSQ